MVKALTSEHVPVLEVLEQHHRLTSLSISLTVSQLHVCLDFDLSYLVHGLRLPLILLYQII